MSANEFDVVILGAGAAGLMCAFQTGRRGLKVLVLEHNDKIGAKILISGGGRCNFTNLSVSAENFVSQDPRFCEYALSQFPSKAFIKLLNEHQISFHEKKLGQLFCDRSARDVVQMFEKECQKAKVRIDLSAKVKEVNALGFNEKPPFRFKLQTEKQEIYARSLVLATGGLSIPQIGATGLGYEMAKKFGLKIVPRHPGLDGFIFSQEETKELSQLAGISVDCQMSCRGVSFRENILFTHKGVSGPAALQASLYWYPGDPIEINFFPDFSAYEWLKKRKAKQGRMQIKNVLTEHLVSRFADYFTNRYLQRPVTLGDLGDKELKSFCQLLEKWVLYPKSTVGYNKAEVTRGGVDTRELDPKTMEAKKVPGLYIIGEVVDVTGWLGGYNFQWAWASAYVAAQSLEKP